MTQSNTRRRSVSVSNTPYDTPNSLWNNKSYFLSRFKSPTTPPITPSTSTSTSIISTTLPSIRQQKIKRKPITASTLNSRKKYEAVLGIKTEDILSEDLSKKKSNVSNRSFGKLFKKKHSKSVDKKNNADSITSLFFNNTPIHADTPKPLENYKPQYHRYEVKEQPSVASKDTTRWSNTSTRKSTGSYSIYSTFGNESIYDDGESIENLTAATSVCDINENSEKDHGVLDLANIVANNVQTRNQARLITTVEYEEEEDEEEDDDDDDEDDDEEEEEDKITDIKRDTFVDATGISQQDIDREKIENRLSKRLSGGHFGSAGGLMMSIMDTKQKRTSRPPPEDVVQSMMNWKRHSGQMLDKVINKEPNQVISDHPPQVPEKDILSREIYERPLPPNPQILLEEPKKEHIDYIMDPKECASKLWHEDESFVQRERIAEWLGQGKSLNTDTLQYYMEYFDFFSMRLDAAFRKVCSKLYFRAEAQQIDRILEAFAKRYWQCNPKSIFGSADTVYAVVYSVLLLNTDLHVAQGNYTRMTRQAFVKNTMSTIKDQQLNNPDKIHKSSNFMLAWEAHIEAYLKDMYISVKNYQILQPLQNKQIDINNDLLTPTPSTSSKRMSMIGSKRMIDIKRSLNTMIHKTSSTRESILFLDEPLPRKSTSSSNKNQLTPTRNTRRESFSSVNSGNSSNAPKLSMQSGLLSPNHSHMMTFMETHADELFNSRPPYLKEGVVMRKHLLESANQKAKHREWRECLLVVGQGELKMYGLQSDMNDSGRKNMIRASSASFANLADSITKNYTSSTHSVLNDVSPSSGRWTAYSQLIGSIELNHSLANSLPPPGYNRTRPFVFAIQEPNGGVYLIQAGSQEQIIEWVSTCNYWAARLSKEPLQGGVSNIEYGWGSCLDDVILDLDAVESGKKITGKYFRDPDAVHLSSWVPPTPTMVSSGLDEVTHYDNLQKYLVLLNQEINDHREIKKKILVKFPQKSQNHSRALSNWEAKSKYMLHDIIKYQNYCDVLEKSILKHQEEEDDDKEDDDEE